MPSKEDKPAPKRQKREAKEAKKDHLKSKLVEAGASKGSTPNLSNDLEAP